MNKKIAFFVAAALSVSILGTTAEHAHAEFKQLALAIINYNDYSRRPPAFDDASADRSESVASFDDLDILLLEFELLEAEELDLEELFWLYETFGQDF